MTHVQRSFLRLTKRAPVWVQVRLTDYD
jgi:hypothetical protein